MPKNPGLPTSRWGGDGHASSRGEPRCPSQPPVLRAVLCPRPRSGRGSFPLRRSGTARAPGPCTPALRWKHLQPLESNRARCPAARGSLAYNRDGCKVILNWIYSATGRAVLIDALNIPLHALRVAPESPNSLGFPGRTVNAGSFRRLHPASPSLGVCRTLWETLSLLVKSFNQLDFQSIT